MLATLHRLYSYHAVLNVFYMHIHGIFANDKALRMLTWQEYLGSVLRRTAWPYPGTTLPDLSVLLAKSFTSSALGSSPSCNTNQCVALASCLQNGSAVLHDPDSLLEFAHFKMKGKLHELRPDLAVSESQRGGMAGMVPHINDRIRVDVEY